jgi:hypothetical protein
MVDDGICRSFVEYESEEESKDSSVILALLKPKQMFIIIIHIAKELAQELQRLLTPDRKLNNVENYEERMKKRNKRQPLTVKVIVLFRI